MKHKKEKSSKRSRRSKSAESPAKRQRNDDSRNTSPKLLRGLSPSRKSKNDHKRERKSSSPPSKSKKNNDERTHRSRKDGRDHSPDKRKNSGSPVRKSRKSEMKDKDSSASPKRSRREGVSPSHERRQESRRKRSPSDEDRNIRKKSSRPDEDRVVGSRYYDVEPVDRKKHRDDKIEESGRKSNRDLVLGDRYYGGPTEERKRKDDYEKSRKEKEPVVETEEKGTTKVAPPKKTLDPISSKTGGAYIPPAMLRMMQASITDKSSAEYQRISWEALKKSIHGLINKVNRTNIDKIIRQLLKENIVRGRGLLCRSITQAQAMSITFTPVYAALVALINSRFPNIGELLLKRLVIQFRRGFKRNDKTNCIAAATFIAHLVNQRVAHEILALEILTLLVETPSDDSIEVAIAFLKECGMKLTEVSSKGVDAIIQMLRNVLHERKSDARSMHMIQVMMQIRKDKFKDNESIPEGLDLVEEEDQFTHLITLDDATDAQDMLNVFKFDPEYLEHEEKYKELSKEIVGDESDEESGSDEEDDDEDDEEGAEDDPDAGPSKQVIVDNTETNLVALRRTIYLTIYSSLDFEECAHKLMKMNLKPGQEPELCAMILDCCCEMRTYERFFGLLAQRFCQVNRAYIPPFESLFKDTYSTIHRLKTSQCRNVAKLFGHLFFTDAISWNVLSCIRLNEEDTTSSGRIFIKILFHELSEYMGLAKLNDRVKDVTLQDAFSGLFPRDNPRSTRFSINFFTSIGLGGLTDDLREHLKAAVKSVPTQLPGIAADASPSSSSVSSSSDSEDLSSSSSSSSSSSESSDEDSSDDEKRKKSSRKRSSKKKSKETMKKRKKSPMQETKRSKDKKKRK